jgi:hypothetical protein
MARRQLTLEELESSIRGGIDKIKAENKEKKEGYKESLKESEWKRKISEHQAAIAEMTLDIERRERLIRAIGYKLTRLES